MTSYPPTPFAIIWFQTSNRINSHWTKKRNCCHKVQTHHCCMRQSEQIVDSIIITIIIIIQNRERPTSIPVVLIPPSLHNPFLTTLQNQQSTTTPTNCIFHPSTLSLRPLTPPLRVTLVSPSLRERETRQRWTKPVPFTTLSCHVRAYVREHTLPASYLHLLPYSNADRNSRQAPRTRARITRPPFLN